MGLAGALASSALALPAAAQVGPTAQGAGFAAEQLQRQLNIEDAQFRDSYFRDTPIAERMLVDAGGSFRYAFNSIDNPQGQAQQLYTYDTRLWARAELDGIHRAYGRIRLLYNDWEWHEAPDPGDEPVLEGLQDPIGELYWYELDSKGSQQGPTSPQASLRLRVGRQYVIWAQGVSLSGYMYAGTADIDVGPLKFSLLVGETAGTDTTDWDISRPGFDWDTDRRYFGGMVQYTGASAHRPFLYVLAQQDGNSGQTAVLPTAAPLIPTTFDYESNYLGIGSSGSFGSSLSYRGELVYEWGTTLSDSIAPGGGIVPAAQVEAPISAFAMVLGGTWLARDNLDTRIDAQVALGTGSGWRIDSGNTFGGVQAGHTDHSFNSLGYVNTGLVLAPELANLFCPSLGISANPFAGVAELRELRLGMTAYLFAKMQADAPISLPTNVGGSNFVGGELDFTMDWRILSDFSVSAKYGIFLPNSEVFAPNEDGARQYFYVGATYSF